MSLFSFGAITSGTHYVLELIRDDVINWTLGASDAWLGWCMIFWPRNTVSYYYGYEIVRIVFEPKDLYEDRKYI